MYAVVVVLVEVVLQRGEVKGGRPRVVIIFISKVGHACLMFGMD